MGCAYNNTDSMCLGRYFTYEERISLEAYLLGHSNYKKIVNKSTLASIFHKSRRTIQREINRGLVIHQRSEIPFEVIEYNAEYAQNLAVLNNSAKGPDLKIGHDRILEKAIIHYVKDLKYSPYAIIATFNKQGWPSSTRVCEKTLYNYINDEVLDDLTSNDLLLRGKRKKASGKPKKHSRAFAAAHSITQRPAEVATRETIGHWEGDCVVGPKGDGSTSLYTMTERSSKLEIIRKIDSRKKTEVVKVLNTLEKSSGSGKFRNMVKTITYDNGVEFSDGEKMMKSVLTKGSRCDIYYAHPYSSFERGTNENHNGIIRRFIKKGTDITDINKRKIREIQDWMNNYPRKSLNGLTPIEKAHEMWGKDFKLPAFLEKQEGIPK